MPHGIILFPVPAWEESDFHVDEPLTGIFLQLRDDTVQDELYLWTQVFLFNPLPAKS